MTTPISFEFFPPNTPVGTEKLKTVVQELGALKPQYFSVTYGAGGSTREKTLSTVTDIAAAGYEAAPHLSCIGSTRESIAEILATYRAQGIHRLVALRGDLPSGTAVAGEFRYAAELIAFVRETQGPDCARPMLRIDGRDDGAISKDGRVQGTYVHGLFAGDAFRRAWLAGFNAASSLAYEHQIEQALDALADHLEAHVDIDAILSISRRR